MAYANIGREKMLLPGFSSVRDRVQSVRPPHGSAQQAVQGEPTSTHLYILHLSRILSPNF
jgi:hypothetical protein